MKKAVEIIRRKGLWRTLRYGVHWCFEKYHERHLGIQTAGYIHLSDLGLGEHDPTCGSYEPISYRSILTALLSLDIRPDRDVFIDYGSGKGRAVIVAATFPFKRVMGIELSEELNTVARANAERAKKRLRCKDLQFVTGDAVAFDPPDDITIVLLYNPFSLEMMQAVVNKICASLARRPRALHVIVKYPYWAVDPLSEDKRFTRILEHRSYSDMREKLRIYEHSEAAPCA